MKPKFIGAAVVLIASPVLAAAPASHAGGGGLSSIDWCPSPAQGRVPWDVTFYYTCFGEYNHAAAQGF